MNFIKKHLNLIGILLLATFGGAAAGLYFDVPGRLQNVKTKDVASQHYTCPMHPEVVSAKPGACPKCGMALTLASEPQSAHAGCGAGEHTGASGCGAKPQASELKLPPGHPPISQPPAQGCCATAAATDSANTNSTK
jgi:hypothetical protein